MLLGDDHRPGGQVTQPLDLAGQEHHHPRHGVQAHHIHRSQEVADRDSVERNRAPFLLNDADSHVPLARRLTVQPGFKEDKVAPIDEKEQHEE